MEIISDVVDVVTTIANKTAELPCCKKVDYEYHSSKDYYSINFQFAHCNSEYNDCIVFYPTNENFDKDEILTSLDEILGKAAKVCA